MSVASHQTGLLMTCRKLRQYLPSPGAAGNKRGKQGEDGVGGIISSSGGDDHDGSGDEWGKILFICDFDSKFESPFTSAICPIAHLLSCRTNET